MKRQWYKKKRLWLGALFILWGLAIRMDWAKFRYNKEQLLSEIHVHTQKEVSFGEKKLDDRTINFLQIVDPSENHLVVLVHGSPGSLDAYKNYLCSSELNEQCNMLAVDRPGFGYSDNGNTAPSIKTQAALIAEILKGFPQQKKILVGHSLGGPVIAKVAMDYASLVDGMIMVAPSISPELEPSNTWRKTINYWPLRILTPAALRVCNQEIIPLENELSTMMDQWTDISIPVTVIHGEEDTLVPVGNSDFAKEQMIHTEVKQVTIQGGNHFILWSEWPLISKEIIEMIGKLEEKSD